MDDDIGPGTVVRVAEYGDEYLIRSRDRDVWYKSSRLEDLREAIHRLVSCARRHGAVSGDRGLEADDLTELLRAAWARMTESERASLARSLEAMALMRTWPEDT